MNTPIVETDLAKILERIEDSIADSRRENGKNLNKLTLTEIKVEQNKFGCSDNLLWAILIVLPLLFTASLY